MVADISDRAAATADPSETDSRARAMLSAVLSAKLDSELSAGVKMVVVMLEGQNILRYKDGEQERFKFVTTTALKAAFVGEPSDSGWLPSGIVRWGEGVTGPFVVRWIAPRVHTLTVEYDAPPEGDKPKVRRTVLEEIKVPLPGMIFMGLGRNWYLWALRDQTFVNPQVLVYSPPVPNVYAGGRICWGSNVPPEASAKTVDQAWDLFLSAPFNADLSGNRSRKAPNDVRVHLAELAQSKAKSYPVADLVQDGYENLDKVITTMVGGDAEVLR